MDVSDLFLPPPTSVVAEHYGWPILSGLSVLVALAVGVRYTRQTRTPLFIACAVSGATLYPFVIEPLADYLIATWYPPNQPIIATVFDRPIPWFVFLGYAGGIPLVCVAAYELAKVLPSVQGWRWVMVPFIVAVCLPVYALIATWPAYLAIQLEVGPVLGRTAGLGSTLLNLAVVLACAYSPTLTRLRRESASVEARHLVAETT
jgi:phosphotransferase system  glucose/maltose/N-acetylglucosamine-specific IIC component